MRFAPGILESHGAVEHQMVGLGVLAVQAEVSLPHELKAVVQSGVGERRFEFRLFDDQGIRVDEVQRVFAFGDVARIFQREEVVVKADFGIDGGGRIDPVDGAFDFSAVGGVAALCRRVVGAVDAGDIAAFVLFHAFAFDEIGTLEANFAVRFQAEILFGRIFHEVVPLDEELLAKEDFAGSGVRVFRVVFHFDFFGPAVFPVVDDDGNRVQNRHGALGGFVQLFADAEIEQVDIDHAVRFGYAYPVAELTDGSSRVAAAAQSAYGRHPGVVPAHDTPAFDEFQQLALAHHRVRKIQAGKFDLLREIGKPEGFQEPVVKGTVRFKFQRADGMGDALHPVRKRVRIVVHRVDAPIVSGAVVRGVLDAVNRRVAHIHVGAGEVDFGAERLFAVGKFPGFHPAEKIQIFFDAPVPVRRGLGRLARIVSAVVLHFFRREVIDVGFAQHDELFGEFVKLAVVVARIMDGLFPVETEPMHVVVNRIDLFRIFFGRVRIVKAEIGLAAEFFGGAEIQADAFGVSDMDVTVRFGRESGEYVVSLASLQIADDDVLDKIGRFRDVHSVLQKKFQPKVSKGLAKNLYSERMICPYCRSEHDKVVDSRSSGLSIRRRRECLECGKRFTTYEYVEMTPLTVVKRDGCREPFQREKLLAGLEAACKKRPVSRQTIEDIATDVENALVLSESQEVRYDAIGNLVMEALRKVDAVAYVRFASVYREFKEVGEFVEQVLQLDSKK